MDTEMIEKLKKNEKGFGFLEPEEQVFLKSIGNENRLFFSIKGWAPDPSKSTNINNIFRIKPDYQPEPEYEDIEIVKLEGGYPSVRDMKILGIYYKCGNVWLGDIPAMPDFWDFIDLDAIVQAVDFKYVASRLRLKHKVVARFRR